MQKLLMILIFLFCFQGSLIVHAESTLKVAFIRGGSLWIKIGDKETQITSQGNVGSPDGHMMLSGLLIPSKVKHQINQRYGRTTRKLKNPIECFITDTIFNGHRTKIYSLISLK